MSQDQAEEDRHSSLASNGDRQQSWETPVSEDDSPEPDPSATPQSHCPRKEGYWFISTSTGVMIRARCRAHFCGYCGPINAAIEARAIALAKPRRAIRLSLVGNSWQDTRGMVNRLIYVLRRDGFAVEMSYHVEPNPRETGRHAHAWQHGDYIPQDHLQRRCQGVGMGIPYIDAVRQDVGQGRSLGYGLKGISYGMKLADSEEQMMTFLDHNGGRLVHATRGFWRDGDERITLVEARKRASAREGGDPGPWELVRFGW